MAPTRPAATLAPAQQGKKIDLPMGVDADGNFYRGDLKAPVKLVEFSDFQ
jgi:protein-disulfide isomerase